MEPRPPMTTIEMMTNDVVGSKVMSVPFNRWVERRKAPAYPAKNPDRPNARSLVRRTGDAHGGVHRALAAHRNQARVFTPFVASSQMLTGKTDSDRTAEENQAKARCELKLMPNNDGRLINVEAGFGSPVHRVLWIPGTVHARSGQDRPLHEDGGTPTW